MAILLSDQPLLEWAGDSLAIALFEDAVELTGELASLDEKFAGILKELIAEEEFTGKVNSTVFARVSANSPIRKIILVGLGKPEALKIETLRRVAAAVGRVAKTKKQNPGIEFSLVEQ